MRFNDHNNSAKVGIYSYGLNTSRPTNAMYEFDVSNFRDPQGQKSFAHLDGRASVVRDWIRNDERVQAVVDLAALHIADGVGTNRIAWMSIGVKDIHGRYIAPAVAELIAEAIEEKFKLDIMVKHYGLGQ